MGLGHVGGCCDRALPFSWGFGPRTNAHCSLSKGYNLPPGDLISAPPSPAPSFPVGCDPLVSPSWEIVPFLLGGVWFPQLHLPTLFPRGGDAKSSCPLPITRGAFWFLPPHAVLYQEMPSLLSWGFDFPCPHSFAVVSTSMGFAKSNDIQICAGETVGIVSERFVSASFRFDAFFLHWVTKPTPLCELVMGGQHN